MRITAVVVSHSRPDLLLKVVHALQEQTLPPDQILVVDNASEVPAAVRLQGDKRVSIIRSEDNLGGAGGFALGIRQARLLGSDWIWLLDDDAIPQPDALGALVQAMPRIAGNPGALCGTVIEYGAIAVMHRRRFDSRFGVERCVSLAEYRQSHVAIDIGSFVGFMVSAAAVDAVGLPDPDFFLSYDDTEYSLRMKTRGFDILLVPSSIVDHLRCADSRLRHSPFGHKHYFNIRNRIAVKRAYAHYSRLSASQGILFGIALWVMCKGRFRYCTLQVLMRAIADGYHGRLGPYPSVLKYP